MIVLLSSNENSLCYCKNMWQSTFLMKCAIHCFTSPSINTTQRFLRCELGYKMAQLARSVEPSVTRHEKSTNGKSKKTNPNQIDAIKAILKRHNIDASELNRANGIFGMKPWIIDKRIKILQELGISAVTLEQIDKFTRGLQLTVQLFKANIGIDGHVNLARKFMSHLQESKMNWKEFDYLNEETTVKTVCIQCTLQFLKSELRISDECLRLISIENFNHPFYNSMELLEKMLKFLRNELHFEDPLIEKNISLLQYHPEYAEAVLRILEDEFQNDAREILKKRPAILRNDPDDMRTLISALKNYKLIHRVLKCPQILKIRPDEFVKRVEYLLQNPYTLVFQKHQSFLSLVLHYPVIVSKLSYLKAKNHKYATIFTLTNARKNKDQLSVCKMSNRNLLSFLETQFDDGSTELLDNIKRHPYHRYISLVQMYEASVYLKEHFPIDSIKKQIYSTLYEKSQLKSAHETLLQDSEYNKLGPDHLLAMCIYKLEEKYHFTGEGVFSEVKQQGNEDEGVKDKIEDAKDATS